MPSLKHCACLFADGDQAEAAPREECFYHTIQRSKLETLQKQRDSLEHGYRQEMSRAQKAEGRLGVAINALEIIAGTKGDAIPGPRLFAVDTLMELGVERHNIKEEWAKTMEAYDNYRPPGWKESE